MKLKSYFSSNIEGALRLARMELGPDAMLVQSRKAPPEARHLGDCEVVVAVSAVETPGAAGSVSPALADELADLRRRLDRMTRALTRSRNAAPETPPALAALLASELAPDLARDVYRSAGDREPGREALAAELSRRFEVNPTLGHGGGPRIAALVGPCGSGKTTTIAKLAATYGIAPGRSTLLISMDHWRIAGADQLRSLAAILGLSFAAPETPAALAQTLDEHRMRELILIDTPGHSHLDLDASAELAALFSQRDDIDVHLTLTASMKPADLTRVVDRFNIFRPSKLIFTRLDETGTFGPLVSEAVESGLPVSFLGTGQQVPEDLEPALKARVVDLVLGEFGTEDVARK